MKQALVISLLFLLLGLAQLNAQTKYGNMKQNIQTFLLCILLSSTGFAQLSDDLTALNHLEFLQREVIGPYKHWFSDVVMPQDITLDLGMIYGGLQVFTVVPNHMMNQRPDRSSTDGNVVKCKLC